MKQIRLFIIFAFLISGCAQEEETAVADAANESEPVLVEASAPAEPDAYYEYLWCKQGSNYSSETFWAMVKDWNNTIDKLDHQPRAAFGYVPRGWEDPNFDAMWVLNWPDKDAMEAGWADYVAANAQTELDKLHPDVLTCGAQPGVDRFGLRAFIPKDMPASFDGSKSPYYLTNQLCTYNEGKSGADLRKVVRGTYLPLLDSIAATNPDTSYFFRVGIPDFEPLADYPVSFNWVNLWQTAEEGEASAASFEGSEEGQEVLAMFAEVAACNPEPAQAWNGYLLRRTAMEAAAPPS